jgi:hypothetical protein
MVNVITGHDISCPYKFAIRLRSEFRECDLLRLSIYSLELPVGADFAHVLRHSLS